MVQRVLLIDDDLESSRRIANGLSSQDFAVFCARDLDEGLTVLAQESFDAVLVEQHWESDARTGLEVCHYLRGRGSVTPVVVLCHKGGLAEELLSLQSGADDWIAKPSSPINIGARVKKRVRGNSDAQILRADDASLNLQSMQGRFGKREISFTEFEAKFLAVLMAHPGRIFSKNELVERVWGVGYPGTEHALKSIVKRLRKKIEVDPRSPVYLLNLHGQGYRLGSPKLRTYEAQEDLSVRPAKLLAAVAD